MIAANDDYNDRVIVIDPKTKAIVWQYGHTGVISSANGYLSKPVSLPRLRATLQRWLPGGDGAASAIDPSVLDPWLPNDASTRQDLLRKFGLSAWESGRDIETAMAAGDLPALAAAAHRLKGSALAVGARALSDAATTLERAAKAGDRAACQDGLGPLAVEVQRARAEIGD